MTTASPIRYFYSERPSEPRSLPFSGLTLGDVLKSQTLSREMLEISRWPVGPVCIRCGAYDKACQVTSRPGLWTCKACRNCQYTVTSHTPLHGTRIEISKWVRLFCFRKIWHSRINCTDLSRDLEVSYLTTRRMIQKVDELEKSMPAMAERLEKNLRILTDEPSKVPQSFIS